jgi:gliding motility-associated-like protein
MKNVYFLGSLLFSCSSVYSQCCSNGVNLLANYNPDFSAPFVDVPPGFITANPYTFYPTPGTYIIVPVRDYGACFSTPQADHTTGDPINGRFLWFDASATASPTTPDLAWQPFDPSLPAGTQSLISVLPNTLYVFSCWIRDLAREPDCITGGSPLMGLRINGVELAEVDLGLITDPCCPQWTYLCAEWNSGENTNALIQIESRRADGWNDLGIDDVYFGTTTEALQFSLGADTTICEGASLLLSDNIENSTNFWSDYSSGDSLHVTSPGTYWLEVTKNNCKARDSITVTMGLLPEINLGNDTSFCNQNEFLITPTNIGGQISNYVWQNNSTSNSIITNNSGNYWLQASNSCGVSGDTINLLFFQPIIPIDSLFICLGTAYTLSNGTIQNSPGTYLDTLNVLGYYGCDSIIQRVINWYPINFDTIQVALCSGASFISSSGLTLTQPGFYLDTLSNQNHFGCDSLKVIEIQIILPINSIQNLNICNGQSYVLPNGTTVFSSGTYLDTLSAMSGCDSIVTTNLTIFPPISSTQNIQICNGLSYVLPNGTTAVSSGTYLDTLSAMSGCDSIVTTNLTIFPPISSTQNIQICNGLSYILPNGTTAVSSGTYLDTLSATSGCDSIVTTNLTIFPPISSTQNIQICNGLSYILPNGTTAVSSGTYLDTLSAMSGCDSIVIINLNFYQNDLIPILPEMDLCPNDSISFSLSGDFSQIAWSNGQNGSIVTIYEPGNYTVFVSDINGCIDSDNFSVGELVLPTISIELADSSICKGDCIKISVLGTNSNDVSWSINHEYFDPNNSYILYCFNDTGSYDIRVASNEECGIVHDTLTLIIDEPQVFLPSDTLLQFGDSLNLWSQGNYSEFWWQPYDLLLCDSCESQSIAVTDDQRFFLFYSNSSGCIFTKSFLAVIDKEGQLFIPNSFTPNGDNMNDEFYAKGKGIFEFNLKIYNRIGELVFESNDINTGWNGSYFQRQVQQDIYAYIIEYKDYSNSVKIERGYVMLAR